MIVLPKLDENRRWCCGVLLSKEDVAQIIAELPDGSPLRISLEFTAAESETRAHELNCIEGPHPTIRQQQKEQKAP